MNGVRDDDDDDDYAEPKNAAIFFTYSEKTPQDGRRMCMSP